MRTSERQAGMPAQPGSAIAERPIPLLVPPEPVPHIVCEALPLPPLLEPAPDTSLVLGLATIDHSGRVRDRLVMDALRWVSGDRTSAAVRGNCLFLRRTDRGVAIDARGRVYLPAGARTLLGIETEERVVLVAAPQNALLIVHPAHVVTALLAEFYAGYVKARGLRSR